MSEISMGLLLVLSKFSDLIELNQHFNKLHGIISKAKLMLTKKKGMVGGGFPKDIERNFSSPRIWIFHSYVKDSRPWDCLSMVKILGINAFLWKGMHPISYLEEEECLQIGSLDFQNLWYLNRDGMLTALMPQANNYLTDILAEHGASLFQIFLADSVGGFVNLLNFKLFFELWFVISRFFLKNSSSSIFVFFFSNKILVSYLKKNGNNFNS